MKDHEPDWAALFDLAMGAEAGPAGEPEPVVSRAGNEHCTAKAKSTGRRCERWPVAGAKVCRVHGGAAMQVKEKGVQRLQEQQAMALARKTVGNVDLSQYQDPFAALEFAVSYSHALAERLARIVESIPDGELRYRGKGSEQLRGEVTAAQTALRDLRQAATEAARLGLAERRARIEEREIRMLENAVNTALARAGLDFRQQEDARQVIRRELEKADVADARL